MAIVADTVSKWACPDNLVDSLEGGFSYTYDNVAFPTTPPRDDCATAKNA